MQITFSDGVSFNVSAVRGMADNVIALNQIIAESNRNIMEIQFDTSVALSDIMSYYTDTNNKCDTITITDDNNDNYVYTNYTIAVSLAYKAIEGVQAVVMQLAQLNTSDIAINSAISAAIDDITGFTAIEQITELQMAVAELYEIVGGLI